jgi:hypothetical protein
LSSQEAVSSFRRFSEGQTSTLASFMTKRPSSTQPSRPQKTGFLQVYSLSASWIRTTHRRESMHIVTHSQIHFNRSAYYVPGKSWENKHFIPALSGVGRLEETLEWLALFLKPLCEVSFPAPWCLPT